MLASAPSRRLGMQASAPPRRTTSTSAPLRRALQGCRHRRRASRPTALLRVVDAGAASTAPASARVVTWDQSADEVFVRVPVAEDVRGRDVDLEVHPTRLSLRIQGKPVLEGPVEGAGGSGSGGGGAPAEPAIDVDGCFFTLEDGGSMMGRHVLVTLAKRTPGYMSWPELLESDKPDDTVTRRCWLDVAVRGGEGEGEAGTGAERRGRLVLGLYGNAAPRAVANFAALCTGEMREDKAADPAKATTRDALHFLGTPFHRIIGGFMAQGGDTTFSDGTGGLSIYGGDGGDGTFADEPQGLRLQHSGRGVLAMANAGPDTNSSQYYLTFRAAPHLDGKHVVFGRVEAGGEVLAALEALGTPAGAPRGRAAVVGCGALPEGATEEDGRALAAELPLHEVDDGDGDDDDEGSKKDDCAWVWEQLREPLPSSLVADEEEED